MPVSTTYGPELGTSAPELSANTAGGVVVAQADASMPGVCVTGADTSEVAGPPTEPSTAGVAAVSTWSVRDDAPASDELRGSAEIDPEAHPMNAHAKRQT